MFIYRNDVAFTSNVLYSLWFDCILLIFLQKVIDVVVVDFYVGDEHGVAAVLIHGVGFISLR